MNVQIESSIFEESVKPSALALRFNVMKLFRKIPHFRGRDRIAKAILRLLGDQHKIQFQVNHDNLLAFPCLTEPVAFYHLIDGAYEPETNEVLRRFVAKETLFVDVGANIGAFTIVASSLVGTSGRVLAIEASKEIYPFLRYNIEVNQLSNVDSMNTIAASQNGNLEFTDAPVEKFGMGSRAKWPGKSSYTMPSRSVDNLIHDLKLSDLPVSVIKIDVEGFEVDVLSGLTETLNKHHPLVVFEFNDWAESRAGFPLGAAQDFLIAKGYTLNSLSDFLRSDCQGKPNQVFRTGSEMIVAYWQSN